MKEYLKKIIVIYEYHGRFYSFVLGLEGAAVASMTAYFQSGGQLPVSKTALAGFAGFVGKAVYGYAKGFLINYFHTGEK